jgi:FMN phosphatase YigB (HAD superfamily)
VKPSEALFIGNNPYRDIAGASSIGMKVVWLRREGGWAYKEPPRELELYPEWQIREFSQLYGILGL